jgi:hypothetical protein
MANEPIVNQPNLYVDKFNIARASNTTLTVTSGACRDDSNVYDIVVSSTLTLDMAVEGANGLDTGSIGATKLYYIYAIMDVSGFNDPAVMASLSTSPVMPYGYGAKRIIGYMMTDGSSHFLAGYWSGNHTERMWTYDVPRATSVTAGTSATYTNIDLSNLVPPTNQLPVNFQINWTANAAADTFNMQGYASTGDAILVIAPVAGATAHTVVNGLKVLAQLNSGAPEVSYKVSAVGGVAINVQSFQVSL